MGTTLFTSHNSSVISRPRSRSTGKQLETSRLRSGMHLAGSRARHQQGFILGWIDTPRLKTLDRLNRLKQGKRSFDELLADLKQLLLEAGGHEWADPIKKGYLKGAFDRVKKHLLSLDERESDDGFKDQVKRVRTKPVELATKRLTQETLGKPSPELLDPPDVMEWEPTPARAAEDKKSQRAAWVSRKELEKRKERGLCFRCGASGHIVTGCPYKPARRPAKVASAAPMLEPHQSRSRPRPRTSSASSSYREFRMLRPVKCSLIVDRKGLGKPSPEASQSLRKPGLVRVTPAIASSPLMEGLTLTEEWARAKENDNTLKELEQTIRSNSRKFPPRLNVKVSMTECSIEKNHLCFRGRKWVPDSEVLRTRILQEIHDSIMTGHPGREPMYRILARDYFWPNCAQDVGTFVRNCDICRANAAWKERRHGLLKPLPVLDRMRREISIDFM
ncbi:hypothetical protein ACJ73_04902 [Blastomyces percursus]|uniref:CCHC-type domain-containing protein n=1 Tax=Blastomyces percursus TaxID=1658174 RepID=A0A1J9R7X7_9EURO|nr:hypothetical protein ACJ73_04902 [Blastomyces percursus]